MLVAYKYRLYPNKEQQVYFAKCFGCVRFIYNRMLSDKIDYYKETKQNNRLDLSRRIINLQCM
jgi:putative transposase